MKKNRAFYLSLSEALPDVRTDMAKKPEPLLNPGTLDSLPEVE